MNRQDFNISIKDEFSKLESSIAEGVQKFGYFKYGADAAYNLLSKEISEKDLEIVRLKLLIKMMWMKEFDFGNNWEQFKKENNL
jgi:hypothetical protein